MESNVDRSFFLAEGKSTLGDACVEANSNYDNANKEMDERQKGGAQIDWKSRGAPRVALFARAITRAIGRVAQGGIHPNEQGHAALPSFWAGVVEKQAPQMLGLL
eukprot:2835384-Pyramimonas_sp.AAC.1